MGSNTIVLVKNDKANLEKALAVIESDRGGLTYLEFIPEIYRAWVSNLAEANHGQYPQFGLEEFRQLMAMNWLLKRMMFGSICRGRGYSPEDGQIQRDRASSSRIACLSMSASIVLIPAHCMAAPGATITYAPIPHRGDDFKPVEMEHTWLKNIPSVGSALYFEGNVDGYKQVSMVIEMYLKTETSSDGSEKEEMKTIVGETFRAFSEINTMTLGGGGAK